jgi:23S rRNA (uracil1939-C5)-methyltransferase
VVLDPPRTGLPRGSAADLARLEAERVVYLSCDPATLARDLGELSARGYALHSVQAIDLFPQTSHVEALALLGRAAA